MSNNCFTVNIVGCNVEAEIRDLSQSSPLCNVSIEHKNESVSQTMHLFSFSVATISAGYSQLHVLPHRVQLLAKFFTKLSPKQWLLFIITVQSLKRLLVMVMSAINKQWKCLGLMLRL